MVRLKHRYLLINILYPSKPIISTSTPVDTIPSTVQFHAPTPDQFNVQLLNRMIRDGVEDLFGDYGISMIASSLKGKLFPSQASKMRQITPVKQSCTSLQQPRQP
jgi:ribonuclease P/MRP protein subunit POP5